MAKKITLNLLGDRMEMNHKYMIERFDNLDKRFDKTETEVCLNSDFRKQAKTTLGFIGTLAGIMGAFITLVINKIWK